ncbi:leucine-rich repeat-containing protein 40-like [Saccostrea echinata]|uniref:leucine-rich repeat-containing protein 40-like n=1 Tax=Saccostrea echinata TaxID=191078 RepID=UPI002A810488|nr:leucine-rich repeat-containing protein 40-like [Saccostrea echinata]
MKKRICFALICRAVEPGVVPGRRASCTPPISYDGTCSCENDVVTCTGQSAVPSFSTMYHYKKVSIVNGNFRNAIRTGNPFANLRTDELVLHNMTILAIAPHAFLPVKSMLKKLDLSNNFLTVLPSALHDLDVLESLDVSENSIGDRNFTEEVLRKIGATLKSFTFGSYDIQQWPVTLKHLQMLQNLNVTKAAFQFMPQDAFYGFSGTLLTLSLGTTGLTSVPLAVAQLRYLQTFNFDHNINVGDYGMNVPLIRGRMPYLTNISLQQDSLKTFPSALSAFENLKSVSMDLNTLDFVSDHAANSVRQIENLSMRNSNISRIPQALADITSLKSLDLSDNRIHSIDVKDVKILHSVKEIKLNNNPILYISNHAFDSNGNLERLELRNTHLKEVPCALKYAIENLTRVKHNFPLTVDISNNAIACTCELKWLADTLSTHRANISWNIIGNCETIVMSINDYLNSESLRDCPTSNIC